MCVCKRVHSGCAVCKRVHSGCACVSEYTVDVLCVSEYTVDVLCLCVALPPPCAVSGCPVHCQLLHSDAHCPGISLPGYVQLGQLHHITHTPLTTRAQTAANDVKQGMESIHATCHCRNMPQAFV